MRARIDWPSAEVHDGELRVAFEEPVSADVRARMKALVERLQRPGEPWDAIAVKKDRLVVSRIEDDAEDDVRHFLESLVLEANAAEAGSGPGEGTHDAADERDRRMTETFQAFGAARDRVRQEQRG